MNENIFKTALLNAIRKGLFKNPLMEKGLRQFTRGRNPTDWICRVVPNHYQYHSPSIRQVNSVAGSLDLDLSDWMEWHLYYDFLDPSTANLLTLCQPGDQVLDIGANIGSTMLPIAERVGENGLVVGFEPDPGRFAKCDKLLTINGARNARVHQLAIGSSVGKNKLRIRDPNNLGMNQIVPNSIKAEDGIPIQMITLDEYLNQNGSLKVDVIKIDVEGYEAEVLKGAPKILQSQRPRLFIEIDERNLSEHGSSPNEIFRILTLYDYSLYRNSQQYPLKGNSFAKCHFDLVAYPKATQPWQSN